MKRTKNVTAKTKHECVVKLDALKESLGKSTGKISADMPFGEWMDFWYQTYSKPGLRPSHRPSLRWRIKPSPDFLRFATVSAPFQICL